MALGREASMKFTLLETTRMRSAIQVLWHYATPEVKAAFLADDDNPEELISMIDTKISEYADEIRKAVKEA